MRRAVALILLLALVVPPSASQTVEAQGNRTITVHDTVSVKAAAVSRTPDGLEGSTARIDVTVAPNGSGHVFMDTSSFTQVDMQGSAKLATRVASALTGLPRDSFDYFIVVDTASPIIGGPSAGAEMAVATVAAMEGWTVDDEAMMTGTVNLDGSVGPVGGIPEKAEAAREAGAGLFLFPQGQANATTGDGDQVHVPTYCDEELGITCEPVATVRDAVAAMTGHRFPRPQPEGNVTGADYKATLRPLGHQLVDRANATIATAEDDLDSANLSSSLEDALRSRLSSARDTRDDALDAVERARYYTAASRAFQSTVGARTVVEAVDILGADDPDLRYRTQLSAVEADVREADEAASDRQPQGLTELQAVGAAQSRVLDAEDRTNQSRQGWQEAQDGSAALQAVADLAFAAERAETVHWWLRIAAEFPPGPPVNATEVQDAARDIVPTARDAVAYARVLSDRSEGQNPLVREASRLLRDARLAQDRGYHAAAIYNALQAETWANTGVSVSGLPDDVVDSRVDRARDRSGAAIGEAREAGIEPILAEAYYEFAGDFQNPIQALAYYGYAGTIASSTATIQADDADPNPSRFVGVHPDATPPDTQETGVGPPDTVLGLLALSFATGSLVAIAVVTRLGGRRG